MPHRFFGSLGALLLVLSSVARADSFGHDSQLHQINWKRVFNQIFYWNMKKFSTGDARYTPDPLAAPSLSFPPKDFNSNFEALDPCYGTNDAHNRREATMSFKA